MPAPMAIEPRTQAPMARLEPETRGAALVPVEPLPLPPVVSEPAAAVAAKATAELAAESLAEHVEAALGLETT